MDNQNMTYPELRDLLVERNKTQLAKPVSACIVFAESNWPDRHYPLRSRTYEVSSDNKAFPAELLLHQPVRFLLGWHRPDGSPRLVHEGLRQQGRLGR